MVYLQHRAFLPSVDKLRSDRKNFPCKKVLKSQPTPKTMNYVDAANGRLSAAVSQSEKKKIHQETGCKGSYALRRLPHHDRYLNTPVEPMHLFKNLAEHIVKLLSGFSDTEKVRNEEQNRSHFKDVWITSETTPEGKAKKFVPQAPFSLSKSDLSIGNNRALTVKAPSGTDWRPCRLFHKSAFRMKSNEWKHVLASGILKFCIRGLLGDAQRKTLYEFCDVISLLATGEVNVSELDSLEYRVHRVLSLLERDFPVSLHVIVFHLLHHLPMFIRRFGPTYGFWMYPMERFNSWVSRRVLNRRYPESTVLETYRLHTVKNGVQ